MKHYLKCKKITTAISRAQRILRRRVQKNGIYENFGQNEIREIESVFINISDYTIPMNKRRHQLELFQKWCSIYHNNCGF